MELENILEVKQISNYINGQVIAMTGRPNQAVFNPATGQQSGAVPLSDRADVNAAVAEAKAAFPAWAESGNDSNSVNVTR
jgi:malonate-semialdehyde dehydrogenase (acetylating)/methylmalonate-semialdehyde dehydrogenase